MNLYRRSYKKNIDCGSLGESLLEFAIQNETTEAGTELLIDLKQKEEFVFLSDNPYESNQGRFELDEYELVGGIKNTLRDRYF